MPATTEAPAKDRADRLLETAPMVRRMCGSRLGPHDGQDAAQDVLEAVWRAQHRPGFDADGPRPLFGYAAATARYRVMHGYADRDQAALPSGDLGELLWADPAPGPAEQVERAEAAQVAARQVAALLAQLPPRERQVMLASGLGARPSAETAAELDVPASTVRSAQARAMSRMRQIVGVRSPNPLASPVPENERRRQAAAERAAANGTADRGAGAPPLPGEVHQAGRAAAAAGRSARDLAAEFGVSERTAGRWRAEAARGIDPEVHHDQDAGPADDPIVRARVAVACLPATSSPRSRDQARNHPVAEHVDEGWRGWDADVEAEDTSRDASAGDADAAGVA